MARESVLRPALWIALGVWIGALAYFGAGVAPAVLGRAPSPVAGELVRATLAVLDWSGVALGLLLSLGGVLSGRGRLAALIPIGMVLCCLASQLWVAPAIAAVRPGVAASEATPGSAIQFRRLHRLSVGLYAATCAGVVALVVIHGRRESRSDHRGDSPA